MKLETLEEAIDIYEEIGQLKDHIQEFKELCTSYRFMSNDKPIEPREFEMEILRSEAKGNFVFEWDFIKEGHVKFAENYIAAVEKKIKKLEDQILKL